MFVATTVAGRQQKLVYFFIGIYNLLISHIGLNHSQPRTSSSPQSTASIPKSTLAPMYSAAVTTCPFCIRVSDSSENVENVVKPPHTPTLSSSTSCGFSELFFCNAPAISPIANAPAILIIKVMTGNPDDGFIGTRPSRYRDTEPIIPPSATKIQLINIVILCSPFTQYTISAAPCVKKSTAEITGMRISSSRVAVVETASMQYSIQI